MTQSQSVPIQNQSQIINDGKFHTNNDTKKTLENTTIRNKDTSFSVLRICNETLQNTNPLFR